MSNNIGSVLSINCKPSIYDAVSLDQE